MRGGWDVAVGSVLLLHYKNNPVHEHRVYKRSIVFAAFIYMYLARGKLISCEENFSKPATEWVSFE